MSLTLIILRHAKSSWSDPTSNDHDRPLSGRGRAAAAAVGTWLENTSLVPDTVLCSTATRTQETYAEVKAQLTSAPAPELHKSLYLAPPETMLAALRKAKGARVMMVGHNPGLSLFARALIEASPNFAAFDQFPTGAAAVIEFPQTDWAKVDWGMGHLMAYETPEALIEAAGAA